MLKERNIYEQYKDCGLLKNGYMYLIDGQGNLVSHSDEKVLKRNGYTEYAKEILNETGNYFIDKNQVIMSKKVNDGNWYMIVVIPLNDMLTTTLTDFANIRRRWYYRRGYSENVV